MFSAVRARLVCKPLMIPTLSLWEFYLHMKYRRLLPTRKALATKESETRMEKQTPTSNLSIASYEKESVKVHNPSH